VCYARLLPADRRSKLLEAIRTGIETSGGTITIDYVTHLHLAKVRPRHVGGPGARAPEAPSVGGPVV